MKALPAPQTPSQNALSTLPHASDFVRDVLQAANQSRSGALQWPDINRLAARWLHPVGNADLGDTSRLGHALLIELIEQGTLNGDLSATGNGKPMVARLFSPTACGRRTVRRGLAA